MSPATWKKMERRLVAAKKAVQELARSKAQGFLDLPFERKAITESTAVVKMLSKRFTDMVVLGIGGSDLGARALQQALIDPTKQKRGTMRVQFAGASTDPDELTRLLAQLDLKKTCVNIVSKSGDTLEPMSAFLVLRDKLIRVVGQKVMPSHIVATTDAQTGSLRALANKEGYTTLTVPSNVGGRFSVLSSVGLFPAIAMGVDVRKLLAGAKSMATEFARQSVATSAMARYAAVHIAGMENCGQLIHVTVPYTPRLSEFGRWVRQLVAESLGKRKNRNGKLVYTGPTPIAAVGPEDQHSQLQLWSEGPVDKLITFIEIDTFSSGLRTPRMDVRYSPIGQFGGRAFADLIHRERAATAEALRQMGRPNGTLHLKRLDAQSMGALILFFEISVALMGELLNVDAYNQPGVELSKTLMRQS